MRAVPFLLASVVLLSALLLLAPAVHALAPTPTVPTATPTDTFSLAPATMSETNHSSSTLTASATVNAATLTVSSTDLITTTRSQTATGGLTLTESVNHTATHTTTGTSSPSLPWRTGTVSATGTTTITYTASFGSTATESATNSSLFRTVTDTRLTHEASATESFTATFALSRTESLLASHSPTFTPPPTPSSTEVHTETMTLSDSPSRSASPSEAQTATATRSNTCLSASVSKSSVATITRSTTITPPPTPSTSTSHTTSREITASATPSRSVSVTPTLSVLAPPSPTQTATFTLLASATASAPSPTVTTTITPPPTVSSTDHATATVTDSEAVTLTTTATLESSLSETTTHNDTLTRGTRSFGTPTVSFDPTETFTATITPPPTPSRSPTLSQRTATLSDTAQSATHVETPTFTTTKEWTLTSSVLETRSDEPPTVTGTFTSTQTLALTATFPDVTGTATLTIQRFPEGEPLAVSSHILRLGGSQWAAQLAAEGLVATQANAQVDIAAALDLPLERVVVHAVSAGSLVVHFSVSRNASQVLPVTSINAILLAKAFPTLQRQLQRFVQDNSVLVVPLSASAVVAAQPARQLCDERCIVTVVCVGCVVMVAVWIVLYCFCCRLPPAPARQQPPRAWYSSGRSREGGGQSSSRGHVAFSPAMAAAPDFDRLPDADDGGEDDTAGPLDGGRHSGRSAGGGGDEHGDGAESVFEVVTQGRSREPNYSPDTPEKQRQGREKEADEAWENVEQHPAVAAKAQTKNVSPTVPIPGLDFSKIMGYKGRGGAAATAAKGTTATSATGRSTKQQQHSDAAAAHAPVSTGRNVSSGRTAFTSATLLSSGSPRPVVRSWAIAAEELQATPPKALVRSLSSLQPAAAAASPVRGGGGGSGWGGSQSSAAAASAGKAPTGLKRGVSFSPHGAASVSSTTVLSPGRPAAAATVIVRPSPRPPGCGGGDDDPDEIAVVTIAATGGYRGDDGLDPVVLIDDNDGDNAVLSDGTEGQPIDGLQRLQSGASFRVRKI